MKHRRVLKIMGQGIYVSGNINLDSAMLVLMRLY